MSGFFDDIDEADYVEDLSGLDPEFIALLEGKSRRARRNLIALERESMPLPGTQPLSREVIAAVEAEWFTGVRLQRLRLARQARDEAIAQFDAALLAAREVGYSWNDLSSIAGVSRQALQQRFGARDRGGTAAPRPPRPQPRPR